MKNNDIKLYNMILPPFMIVMLAPPWVIISLVGNFLIDSLLLIVLLAVFIKKSIGKQYIRTIFKVWGLGYASDFIGMLYLLTPHLLSLSKAPDLDDNVFIAVGILIASVCIFIFDYFVSFRKCGFTKMQRLVASLSFAIITAPYTFLLPEDVFSLSINLVS